MADKFYELEWDDGLATVTLNRPPANALNLEFTEQLADLFEDLAVDSRLRGAVLTGAGTCFCAGLDLKELGGYDVARQDALIRSFNRMALALYGLRRPTVAAVNGHAVAGGMILLLCCDLRVGPEGKTRFGLTEGQVGVAFPMGALAPAAQELGPAAARRYLLGAHVVEAKEALSDGVLDELAPGETVLSRARELARGRMKLPASYGAIKRQLRLRALDRLEQAVRHGDPLEGHWLSEEVPARIESILKAL